MISIIIAALNEERFLPYLLNDLSDQTIKDYEIIVCDGGSCDKTVEIAKNFGCNVIATELKKQPLQQNLAAKKAKYDLLFFLDADIRILDKDFLKITHDEFTERQLDVAALYSKFIPKRKPLYIICEALINLSTFIGERTRPVAHGGGGIISTIKAHNKVGGFNQNISLGYDHDYAREIAKFGKFGVIKKTRTIMSARRFEKEGFLKVWITWAIFGLYYTFVGLPKKEIISYNMPGGKYYK